MLVGAVAFYLDLLDEPALWLAIIDYGTCSLPSPRHQHEFQRILSRREKIFGLKSHCLIEPLAQLAEWELDTRTREKEYREEKLARNERALRYTRRALEIATATHDGTKITRLRQLERKCSEMRELLSPRMNSSIGSIDPMIEHSIEHADK